MSPGTAKVVRLSERVARAKPSSYPSPMLTEVDQDQELVALAQGGDRRAFEMLVVKYQRRIARHIARYVRNGDDVEELTQEVFIKAYRGLASFRGDSAFYSWLYRIATNTALNYRRGAASKIVVLHDDYAREGEEEFEPIVPDENGDPERLLIARQISDTVDTALKLLPPDLAEALLLYEVEGKQYKEIAEMLDIPIGTVRTRIFRAREAIAKRLERVLGPSRDRRW